MDIDVKVPNVGESITEVTIGQWLVKNGQEVKIDQALCEIETDKASQEIYAEKAGVISLKVDEATDAQVGDIIAIIHTDGRKPTISNDNIQSTEDETIVSKNILKETHKETTRAVSDIVEVDVVHVDNKLLSDREQPLKDTKGTIVSPAAGKMIRENQVDLSSIKGTGKQGRVTKQDVHLYNESSFRNSNDIGEQKTKTTLNAEVSSKRVSRQKKMTRIRKTISSRLVAAKNQTAMLTTFNEINCSAMVGIRKKYKESFKETHQVGLGFMSFFIRACSLALLKYPEINAYINTEKQTIIYHDYTDISIAVSTPKGLVVPVIRDVQNLNLPQIEKEVLHLATKGREGSLSMQDINGGTFTITNGGVFGSMLSTPIINPPQSAILGMHKIEDRPIALDGKVVIQPMMYLALSYDHRIVDGKDSVGFLVMVKHYLENPEQLLSGEDPIKTLLGI